MDKKATSDLVCLFRGLNQSVESVRANLVAIKGVLDKESYFLGQCVGDRIHYLQKLKVDIKALHDLIARWEE